MGKDEEEEGREELREMLDDPEVTAGDLLAALIAHVPEEKAEELHEALSSLGEDMRARRGYHSWARDRLEMRRHGKDRAARRARDGEPGCPGGPEHFGGEPLRGGGMEPFDRDDASDRRGRGAHDLAMDSARAPRILAPSGLYTMPSFRRF
jgi:hypothetical protein